MNEQQNRKANAVIIACVAIIGFAVSVVSFVWRINSQIPTLLFGWVCVYYGFVLYYGIKGYKKPHGNMVRYLMLILAVYIGASVITTIYTLHASWPIVLASIFAAMFMAYMAGRLNKVKKNKPVALFVTVMLLFRFLEQPTMSGADTALFVLDRCSPLFMWLTIVLIYFYRFREHKEGGLATDVDD